MAKLVEITEFGLQPGTDRTLYVMWKPYSKDKLDHYEVIWHYWVDGVSEGFVGNRSDVSKDEVTNAIPGQSTYSPPDNADHVQVWIRPVSETKNSSGTNSYHWTVDFKKSSKYYLKDTPPQTPPVPTIELVSSTEGVYKYKFYVDIDPEEYYADEVEFFLIDESGSSVTRRQRAPIVVERAAVTWTLNPAFGPYKIRARTYKNGRYSDYSAYSTPFSIGPQSIKNWKFRDIRANSSTSVYLAWDKPKNATQYVIEYTTKLEYFDASSQVTSESIDFITDHYIIEGLETGHEYFFRIKALNDNGATQWSEIATVVVGKKPSAPTTWSSRTTIEAGNDVTLYWSHNSQDGSRQSYAQVELTRVYSGRTTTETIEIDDRSNDTSETERDVMYHTLSTTGADAECRLEWRVRTKGVMAEYSDWSIKRTIDIYRQPDLSFYIVGSGNDITTLPIEFEAEAYPATQTPITYYLEVVANSSYTTFDEFGNEIVIQAGDAVYSKNFDISTNLKVMISAGDITLANNESYTANCTVIMDSGLEASASVYLYIDWEETTYEPDLEIGVDYDTYSTILRPYCLTDYGEPVEDVLLAVYRREFDGGFTEIASGIEGGSDIYIVDPHPALDYARYRVVATSTVTGAVSYYDPPAFPVEGKAVVIQWAEAWRNFESNGPDELINPPWTGSMLKLPYNIDISDNYQTDVALVNYIGRDHPVTYYGTQKGETSTWNVEIPKNDEETLYAIRRLGKWMGDAYVREPSGSGYWANVSVSFSQTHLETTIPVTFDITRVEGGV